MSDSKSTRSWSTEYGVRKEFYLGQVQPTHKAHVILNEQGYPVAELTGIGQPTATAHLIAAAPDMLRMLLETLAVTVPHGYEGGDSFIDEVQAVVRRATGGGK